MTLLIVSDDLPAGQAVAEALSTAGETVLARVPCAYLVREVVRLAPQTVIAVMAGEGVGPCPTLMSALALLASSAPRAVIGLGGAGLPADPQSLLAWQVLAWLPGPLQVASVQAAVALAAPRFAHDQAQARALAAAQASLAERKFVDRAKGMLMRGSQLSEDDAFALLRKAAMQGQVRLGEVSRGVIEAALAAEAVNLGGQLRMLSQCCVKGLALRACASGAMAGQSGADDALQDSVLRFQTQRDALATLPLADAAAMALADVTQAWVALRRHCVAGPLPRGQAMEAGLVAADQIGEALLDQAERLTTALAAAGGRQHLRVIGLCGRQRMLAQRLAKQALLASLLPPAQAAAQAAAAAVTIQDFEASLGVLEQSPLTTATIRAALVQARAQWQALLDGLRRAAGPDVAAGRAALALQSDHLLLAFEQLTRLYEHSHQVLMG